MEEKDSAEVAFVVREIHHNKGMAKTLLNEMISVAQKRNVKKMHAFVRSENRPMLHVFDRHQFVRRPSESLHEIILELDLKTATPCQV